LVTIYAQTGPSPSNRDGKLYVQQYRFRLFALDNKHAICILESEEAVRLAKCVVRPRVRYRLERINVNRQPQVRDLNDRCSKNVSLYRHALANAAVLTPSHYHYELSFSVPGWQRSFRLSLDAGDLVRTRIVKLLEEWLFSPLVRVVLNYLVPNP
jgi:hypothetical protein